ncbi:N-methyl-L-tryptophan oxidase [Modestobacter versicolor]|nr:N-methyl-L-tryptophan oxidase [Modestobacter versicolor]
MGSAAAAHLAARGQRVLGLEQFTPAHDRGSSHGDSRIIRQAYYEDPAYVPLLRRSYELFEDLQASSPGVLTLTGGLMMGPADSATVRGSLASARAWDLPHELLDAAELRCRFPTFAVEDGTVALHEDRAGFVRPEQTVLEHLRRAAAAGADLRFGEPALGWAADAGGEGVTVRTATGEHRAASLVVSAGAWAPRLLPDLAPHLTVERQLLFWFAPDGPVGPFREQPVFIWENTGELQLYGFPAYGPDSEGVKVAFFRNGRPTDPDRLDRTVTAGEVAEMRAHLARRMPALAGRHLRSVACMYTTTPDQHFVLSVHPEHPQVAVAAGFSGHGFKFVPLVGEVLADLVTERATRHPIALFDPARLSAPVVR